MNWYIYEAGVMINTIYATESFVKQYCATHNYTYELVPEPEPEPDTPSTDLTVWDELDAAYQEGVNDV